MESKFSRLMGYMEIPGNEPTYIFIESEISPQAIETIRDEAGRIKQAEQQTKSEDNIGFDEILERISDAFQARKRVVLSPVVIEDGKVMPITVISIISSEKSIREPKTNFGIGTDQAKALVGLLYPPIENVEGTLLREEYRTTLTEHLDKGNRLVLLPASRLN